MSRLTEIEERLKNATPGPWSQCGEDRGGCECGMIWDSTEEFNLATTNTDDKIFGMESTKERKIADANFIAHSPEDIAWLIEMVRAFIKLVEIDPVRHYTPKTWDQMRRALLKKAAE